MDDDMVVTAFDVRMFCRSLSACAVVACLVGVVMLSTDGAASGMGVRVALLGAMAPVIATVGASLATAQARARGELLAVTGLGVSPLRACAGSVLAAILIGSAGALAVASPQSDFTSLFPRIPQTGWALDSRGAWFASAIGLAVGPHAGELRLLQTQTPLAPSCPAKAPVVFAIALLSVVLPVWSHAVPRWWERVAAGAGSLFAAVLAIHLVAAGRLGVWALLFVPMLLLGHALFRAWQRG